MVTQLKILQRQRIGTDNFYSKIQMQEGKENQLSNFGKLLRKLEIDNVAIPELRQLKQEHAYLEKLKLQRVKIEELKAKHDHAEVQIAAYEEELMSQKQLIEEQHRTIQHLESKLQESERKRTQMETTLSRTTELERERLRLKQSELLAEVEELRKDNKSKDILIFEMEDELEHKASQLKEQFLLEKRKIITEWEEKLKAVYAERSSKDQELQQFKELVTRQHKALQMQNEQYEECFRKNQDLIETITRLEEQLAETVRMRQEAQERVSELVQLVDRMESDLVQRRNGQSAKDQVQQLRKKVSEMAKGEIERIQFIVSEFD